jgi:hypothetical protein
MEKHNLSIPVYFDVIKQKGYVFISTDITEKLPGSTENNMSISVRVNADIKSSIEEIEQKGHQTIKDFIGRVHNYLQQAK